MTSIDETLLTVATVCRNSEPLIRQTLDSVATAKAPWIRYVVVDGASTDGTRDIVAARLGDGVDTFVSEPDRGIYDAMNKAVRLAVPGSYILFLGAGDTLHWLPDRAQFEGWRRQNTGLVFGNVLVGDRPFISRFDGKLRYRNTVHHQALFKLRLEADEQWFDERYRIFSDWDLNLRTWKQRAKFVKLDQIIAHVDPTGVSGRFPPASEIFRLVRTHSGPAWACLSVVYMLLCWTKARAGVLS